MLTPKNFEDQPRSGRADRRQDWAKLAHSLINIRMSLSCVVAAMLSPGWRSWSVQR